MFAKNMHLSNSMTPPTNSGRPTGAASSGIVRNGLPTYVPVPANNYNGTRDGYPVPSEKRRKVSTSGGQAHTSTQPASIKPKAPAAGVGRLSHGPGQTSNTGSMSRQEYDQIKHAQSVPAPSRRHQMPASTNVMHKTPSVRDINAALKTGGTTSPLVDQMATNGPRTIQIGRVPSSGAFEMHDPSLTRPGAMSTTPTNSVPPQSQAKTLQRPNFKPIDYGRNANMPQPTPQAGTQARPADKLERLDIRVPQPEPNFRPVNYEQAPHVSQDTTHSRAQARPIGTAVKLEPSDSRAVKQSDSPFPRPMTVYPDEDKDSVMSDISLSAGNTAKSASVKGIKPSQPQAPVPSQRAADQDSLRYKGPSRFSEEEEHLLIFLKEVKQLKWRALTEEFAKDIPGRPYYTLQWRYSTKTNRRDRSNDPPVLNLPPRWAVEATIDWAAVHAGTLEPRTHAPATNVVRDVVPTPATAPKPSIIHQTTEPGYSSGTDSGIRQSRPRRAPPVNYDVRKRMKTQRWGEGLDETEVDDINSQSVDMDMESPMRSGSPSQAQAAIPENVHVVINEPLNVHFDAEDAEIGLLARKGFREAASKRLPYLASSTRLTLQDPPEDFEWDQLLSREWQGLLLHVDFSPEELKQVQQAILNVTEAPQRSRHTTQRRHLRAVVGGLTDSKRLQLVQAIRRRIPARKRSSIDAFLADARVGKIAEDPRILRLSAARPQKSTSSVYVESTNSMLRQREIGSHSRRGWQKATKAVTYQTRNKMMDTLGPLASWTGASSDIHTVSWSQDGERFAAGAVAVTDRDSMQYNRPNNLLVGNLGDSTIHELAEHSVDREKTDGGANSTHAMFVSQDPKLYTTVTSVAFAPSGKLMYSAGYDESVCIWHLDPAPAQPSLGAKLIHKGEVEMMVVNDHFEGMLATAAKRTSGAPIKLLTLNEDDPSDITKHNFHSEKAMSRSHLNILPQALQFEPRYGGLLLAGFGANAKTDGSFDLTGDLCLWDIETQAQIPIHGSNKYVFDIAFNTNRRYMPLFAAGCVASTNVNRGTRSVIRLYSENVDKYTCPLEIECSALDINDVVWCPQDEHLIAAGCTDGRVYVWDMRIPDNPLMTLSHGHSLMPLQDDIHHERTDTGIRFLSWGDDSTRLYSGSSDGVVKVWDVTRSAEDTFIKNLITLDSGIMAGAFSPDFSKLVLGEVNGSVNVLDVGRDDCSIKDAEKLRYMPYTGESAVTSDKDSITGDPIDTAASDSGIAEGNYLLKTHQLQGIPMGNLPIRQIVQGPNYTGPYDQSLDAPLLRQQALDFQLSMTATTSPQCNIPTCKDNIVTVTAEEIGDSGRSTDRIPDSLREQWSAVDDATTRIIPGKSKCMHCSRPARPSPSSDPDAPVLCERCSFACFRCGTANPIAPGTTTLICDYCAGVWEIGALGYECVEQPRSGKFKLDVPSLRRYGRDVLLEWDHDRDTSFGDEMNALSDYYFFFGD